MWQRLKSVICLTVLKNCYKHFARGILYADCKIKSKDVFWFSENMQDSSKLLHETDGKGTKESGFSRCQSEGENTPSFGEIQKKISKIKGENAMTIANEELVGKIEAARERLNSSIDEREEYGKIYNYSIELDELLIQYMVAEN